MKSAALFTVIFEDDDIIVVNKPSGISVGADRWDTRRQRLDRLVEQIQGLPKLYTVHRIDRETSGLVVFAKNETAHRRLSFAFEKQAVVKRYIAIVNGRPPWTKTTCNLPLIPNGNKQHLTIVDKYQGKKSSTCFTLLGSAGNYSVLEVVPKTGRTHQIRVHAAAQGIPVVCDSLYGSDRPIMLSDIKKNWRGDPFDEKPILSRLGLHAMELSLPAHTVTGTVIGEQDELKLSAPLPRDMAALIRQIEKLGTTYP